MDKYILYTVCAIIFFQIVEVWLTLCSLDIMFNFINRPNSNKDIDYVSTEHACLGNDQKCNANRRYLN